LSRVVATSSAAGRSVARAAGVVAAAAAVAAIAVAHGTGPVETSAPAAAVAGVHGRGYHTARARIHLSQRNGYGAGRRIRGLGE